MFTLLDFYADWCGPCKIMAPIFEKLEKELSNKIEFKKVDVEAEGILAGKFNVMSIPTFVILKNGKEVDRKVGAMPEDIVKSWLNSHVK